MIKHFTSIEDVIIDDDFLAWYSSRTSERAQAWQQWIVAHPQYQTLVDESIQYLNLIKLSEKPVNAAQVEAAHHRLMQFIPVEAPVVPLPSRKKWWMSAAAALLVLLAGAVFWQSTKTDHVKLNTSYGQIAKHELPDGSEVLLDANSNLRMNKSWEANGDREVWLEGEAYFHVKKTSAKNRFIVHANGMDIIVTGTQFNVVNRNGQSNVLLKEGSVTLQTKDGQLLKLVPGDFVTINNHQPKKEAAAGKRMLAWTQAELVFENTPLMEAAKIISWNYGVKVTVEKDVESRTLAGILPHDNLDVLLKTLEESNLQITRKGKEIIISAPKP